MRRGGLVWEDKLLLSILSMYGIHKSLPTQRIRQSIWGIKSPRIKVRLPGQEVIEGDNVREFIEKEIIVSGLGICDATKEEVDLLVSFRSSALSTDYILADMISRRAEIGVHLRCLSALTVVEYTWSFCGGCEYICIWRSCDGKITWKS